MQAEQDKLEVEGKVPVGHDEAITQVLFVK